MSTPRTAGTTNSTGKPTIWYLSLRSPYSWLAIRLAQKRWPELWADAELRVFFEPGEAMATEVAERRIDFPYVAMSRAKHLYILRDVRRIAGGLGLTPTWPVERDPQWDVPSLAVVAALRADAVSGRELALDLTAARWERGEDILDRAVVADSARRAGLDPALADAVDDPQVRAWGGEALEQVQRHGVFGVPMIVVGREPYWGVDRLPLAAAAHEKAEPPPVEDYLGSAVREPDLGGGDHAGGCG
ncbi:DsbA family protein [Myceligenerans crystallogenes]|uniref:DSBA-like thioredoxin domain-containing protein n=1 Tax=Myceligenerans crystallogenes TaxID=316335 RepID=A0ABN2NEY4_9MICO